MKFIYVTLLSIFIMTCAGQNPNIDKGEPEVSASQEDSFTNQYYSPLIALDLQRHKILLQELKEGEISKSEYDSIMIQYGRKPDFSLFYEELEVLLPTDSLHREAMYAEWYIQSDSLLNLPIDHLGSIVKGDSTLPAVFALLAKAHARRNEYLMAIENFETLLPMLDIEKAIIVRKYIPLLYKKDGKFQKAIEELLYFKSNYPQEFQSIWEDLYSLYMDLSKYDLAESLLDEMHSASVDPKFQTENMNKYLDLFWQNKDYTNGIDFISELSDFGSTSHSPGTAINFALASREFEQSTQLILDAYEPYLNEEIYFSYINFKLDTTFHYDDVVAPLEFLAYSNSNDPYYQFTYGYITLANEIMKNAEDREEEKMNLGLAFLSKSGIAADLVSFLSGFHSGIMGEFQNAYKQFDEVGQKHKLYPYALINKAYLTETSELKIKLLKEALVYSDFKESIQERIGDIYLQDENYTMAKKSYKKIIDAKKAEPGLMIKYAHAMNNLKQYQEARKVIEDVLVEIQIASATNIFYKWLSMEDDISNAYEVQGDSYAAEGNNSNAEIAYEKAVEKDLGDIELLGKLTTAYKSQNKQSLIFEVRTRAKEYIESRDEIDAESYHSIVWKIFLSEYENPIPDYSKNVELLLEAIKHLPNEPSFYHGVGNEYKQLGQTQAAINYLSKAIQLDPNRVGVLELLVEIYSEKKDYMRAIPLQERAVGLYRTAGSDDNYLTSVKRLADLLAEAEQVGKGIEICENALNYLESDSLRANLLIKLGDIYWSIDSLEEAGQTYAQSFQLLSQPFLAYNTGLAFYFTMDPKYYDLSEKYFTLALAFPDVSDELKNKAENFVIEIQRKREVNTWPERLKSLSQSGSKDVQDIAKLLILATEFDEINDLIIQGYNETEPEKKYLEYSKEWVVTSYRVSPKLYRSQGKIGLFKSQLDQIKSNNANINSILSYWLQAAESTNIAIDLAIEGYYVKKVDYTGQWEKSKAQIQIGRESIYHGMVALKEIASMHTEFKGQGARVIQASLDYYGKN
ncbi:MAG: tetratricopeptide repeat protein [Candidatus Marinimicrobia bacterium]|nr:tetratricopeptide repeat protein [Candidatus Neomarinimicrobiota bacterium]